MTETISTNSLSSNITFISGLVLLVLFAGLNIFIVNPSPYLYSCYKLLGAAGMACIANSLTGYANLKIGGFLKASGSVAIMIVIIYFYPISGNQNSLYKGYISNEACSDLVNNVYVVINDYQTISVDKGDTIHIDELSGKQDLGPVVGIVGPEGKQTGLGDFLLDQYSIIKDIPHGALIYKLSSDKHWETLTKNEQINITDNNTKLELDINDKEKENNFGFLFIKLRITHSRKRHI